MMQMELQKENTGYIDKRGWPIYVGSLVKYPWYGKFGKRREFTIRKLDGKIMAVPAEDTDDLWPFNIDGETELMTVVRE